MHNQTKFTVRTQQKKKGKTEIKNKFMLKANKASQNN